MKDIATKSTTNYILEKYDLYPKKKYGQNFLIDPRIVEKIVCSSSVDKECAVIEVGPGIGALTQVLARYAGYVRSYEIDTRFKGVYEEFLNENHIDIQYVKVRDEEKNRLYTDDQKEQIQPYIQDYMSNNDEGVLTLYVPLVLVVKDGKVIDGHEGTLDSHDATERKMTDDEKEELTKIYTKLMSEAN